MPVTNSQLKRSPYTKRYTGMNMMTSVLFLITDKQLNSEFIQLYMKLGYCDDKKSLVTFYGW